MNQLPLLFLSAAALAAVLASLCIWSRRRVALKVVALLLTALYLPLGYASLVDLLSRPKPVGLEWRHLDVAEATVLSAVMRKDEAIYLWLDIAHLDEPRAYALPWDEARARELHEATREAEAEGTKVKLRNPMPENEEPEETLFYAEPHAPLPAKPQPKPPMVFKHG